jgi:hypothetical protein
VFNAFFGIPAPFEVKEQGMVKEETAPGKHIK